MFTVYTRPQVRTWTRLLNAATCKGCIYRRRQKACSTPTHVWVFVYCIWSVTRCARQSGTEKYSTYAKVAPRTHVTDERKKWGGKQQQVLGGYPAVLTPGRVATVCDAELCDPQSIALLKFRVQTATCSKKQSLRCPDTSVGCFCVLCLIADGNVRGACFQMYLLKQSFKMSCLW